MRVRDRRGSLPARERRARCADEAGYTEPENVEARIWRPSLPIIHVAAAIQVLLQANPSIHTGDLVTNRPLIEWVIRTAEEYEHLFARSRYRGIDAGKLIKIRLAGN